MNKNVAFVLPEKSVHDALSPLEAERVRRLPVVKGDLIDEMISLVDIAKIDSG